LRTSTKRVNAHDIPALQISSAGKLSCDLSLRYRFVTMLLCSYLTFAIRQDRMHLWKPWKVRGPLDHHQFWEKGDCVVLKNNDSPVFPLLGATITRHHLGIGTIGQTLRVTKGRASATSDSQGCRRRTRVQASDSRCGPRSCVMQSTPTLRSSLRRRGPC
jgi:hypothetical protein